ncbi:MAG: tyrosine--tRNA ligase [Candidatus Babeliales bacterium]
MKTTAHETLALLKQGTAHIIPEEDLLKKLESGKKLVIKLGMDPTAPDLHLGHAVVLAKMRQFQDLGHHVVFLIGDFTARIGDPTGRSKTRPPLSEEDIVHNTKTYFEQVSKILDPSKMTIRYNSEWLDQLSIKDMVKLCGKVTLARIIEREDFANRIAEHQSIGFHELLYPLFQGYDSVALKADVELGGTDQTFNLLMGRFLQEQYGQEPQAVVTTYLLEGLDGHAKMSKSLGNAVGLTEPADQTFGKLMSMPDQLMWRYFHLLLGLSSEEISSLQERVAAGVTHPMELKKSMAYDIVAKFWSETEAERARQTFEDLFQKKDYSQAQEFQMPLDMIQGNPVWIVEFLKELGAVTSSSEAKRLIESGAITIDGESITDFKAQITWKSGMIVKAGKHKIYQLK